MNKDVLLDDSDTESESEQGKKLLSSIFEDPYASTYLCNEGKKRWKCEWCKKDFSGWNATKALLHLVQKKRLTSLLVKAKLVRNICHVTLIYIIARKRKKIVHNVEKI